MQEETMHFTSKLSMLHPNAEKLCSSLLPHRLTQIKASENSIRDGLIPLNLDTNHGYAKEPVENSKLTKREASTGKA